MKNKFTKTAIAVSLAFCGIFNSGAVMANTEDGASAMPDISQKKIMVGFWHNWSQARGYKGGTAKDITLADIPAAYNVVAVAFMKVSDGQTSHIPTFKPYNMSDEAFRADVAKLNQQGRAVLISLGGADAHIELSRGDEKPLADEIIRLVDVYGFDGLDIDLEQNAITAKDNLTVIPEALKMVKQHFKAQGKNFIISMAPEFPYLRTGGGSYEKYITALEGVYDFIAPQYYNQGGDGVGLVPEIDGGHWDWIPQGENDVPEKQKEDFLFYLTDSLASGTRNYIKIPADKLVIGLPSNIDAAASGYVKNPSSLFNAITRLENAGKSIKGLMTWSINWDTGTNAAGQNYGYEFINRYQSLTGGEVTPPVEDHQPPSQPTSLNAEVNGQRVTLTWTASSDNVAVTKYEIYRDGVKVADSSLTNWQDSSTAAGKQYSYYVVALDHAGNRSVASDTVLVEIDETVTPDPDPEPGDAPAWDATRVYAKACEKVSYKGKVFQNGWYVNAGEAPPDESNPWGTWRVVGTASMHSACK